MRPGRRRPEFWVNPARSLTTEEIARMMGRESMDFPRKTAL